MCVHRERPYGILFLFFGSLYIRKVIIYVIIITLAYGSKCTTENIKYKKTINNQQEA